MTSHSRYLPDGDYVVVPDLQAPYHDKRTVEVFIEFLKDYQPDGLLNVGDEADSPEPSRWNKGLAGEYAGTLEAGLTKAHDILDEMIVASGDVPMHLMRSNHADRIDKYIKRYAPAMDTSWNSYPRIMGYGQKPLLRGRDKVLRVVWHDKPWRFARGWTLLHGDEGGMIQSAGGTAMGLAKRTGTSVVCGHTHRAGIQHHNLGVGGKFTSQFTGMEVGNMMNMKEASYLGLGAANWQQAFGVLNIRNGRVHPELVLITNRTFTVNGVTYVDRTL